MKVLVFEDPWCFHVWSLGEERVSVAVYQVFLGLDFRPTTYSPKIRVRIHNS